MHHFTQGRAAARVILVELDARVILTRSEFCAVQTVVPQNLTGDAFAELYL